MSKNYKGTNNYLDNIDTTYYSFNNTNKDIVGDEFQIDFENDKKISFLFISFVNMRGDII